MCVADFHIEDTKIFGFNPHHIKNAESGQLALRHSYKRSQNSINPQMKILQKLPKNIHVYEARKSGRHEKKPIQYLLTILQKICMFIDIRYGGECFRFQY